MPHKTTHQDFQHPALLDNSLRARTPHTHRKILKNHLLTPLKNIPRRHHHRPATFLVFCLLNNIILIKYAYQINIIYKLLSPSHQHHSNIKVAYSRISGLIHIFV